jgi:hypothetical protein
MTAPTPTTRGTPTGTMLENGYQSLITFEDNATIGLYEKTTTPAGLEGGDKIDITTMHNTDYKTYAAQALSEMSDGQMTVGYDPSQLTAINTLINEAQVITQTFSDGSSWCYYGYLKSFTPAQLANGTHPEATCVIVTTNRDPDATGVAEEAPVYTAPTP